MQGYIVKILDKPKATNAGSRPHSVGDYGQVVEASRLAVQVKTAHDTMAWYLKGEVEVYSRSPVDLIIVGGKSLPANKSAVNRAMAVSWMTFRNSCDLKNTYVKIKNEDEYNKVRDFYKDRGYTFAKTSKYNMYQEDYAFVFAKHDDILYVNKLTNPCNCKDITAQVLGVTGEQYLTELKSFYPSSSIPMTQTLEQLKFDNYIKANQSKIVDLSESIDNRLWIVNNIGAVVGNFYSDVAARSKAMSKAFEECNKEILDRNFEQLKSYEKTLKSKEFEDLANALQIFNSYLIKIESLSSK